MKLETARVILLFMQFLIDTVLSVIYIIIFLILSAWIWRLWVYYVNQKYINSLSWVLLDIKLPREIDKSPVAMETALHSLLQSGGVSVWYKKYFKGNIPVYSSLEIASIEGIVHFYLRVEKKYRPIMEASLYAHYPGIEIVEAPDYTSLIRYHHLTKDVSLWGATHSLSKKWSPTVKATGKKTENPKEEMKADMYPLKTYVDYKLEENPKEEHKVDPINTILEFMGSLGKGEHAWFQIVVSDEGNFNGKKFPKLFKNKIKDGLKKEYSVSDMAKERREQIRIADVMQKGSDAVSKYGGVETRTVPATEVGGKPTTVPIKYESNVVIYKKENELNAEDKNEIDLINKKMSKPLLASAIRLIYITKKENFNPAHIQNVLGVLKPYGLPAGNSFSPLPTDPYDYPWEDTGKRRVPWRSEELFDAYVEREGIMPMVHESKFMSRWADDFFWSSSMKARKTFFMLYQIFLHPFSRVEPEGLSVLNLEEIASLWHFPGLVATTPTLPRIDSTKGIAPVNLPQ
ncbi:MAG: protein of unknown function with transrane region [Candidatus Nomurabacteria bacterium]|nr:protein of unknown function with transrane region [Candidatus Nomurabacteria bacterium]